MVTTDEKRYQVEIRVAIRDKFSGYQGLTIEETVQIEGGPFLELAAIRAAILQQIHQVAEKLKESE